MTFKELAFVSLLTMVSASALGNMFGPDGRRIADPFQIRSPLNETLNQSLKAVVLIDAAPPASNPNNWASVGCSGSLVGENILLTNRHCVFEMINNQFVQRTDIKVFIGYQEGKYQDMAMALTCRLDLGVPSIENDWAFCFLDKPLGRQFGFFDLIMIEPPESQEVFLAGYSSDLPGSMYYQRCHIRKNQGTVKTHDCASFGGASGSPIFVCDNRGCHVFAINQGDASPGSLPDHIKAANPHGFKLPKYDPSYPNIAVDASAFIDALTAATQNTK